MSRVGTNRIFYLLLEMLQSWELWSSKHWQPRSVHRPLPLQKAGHRRTVRISSWVAGDWFPTWNTLFLFPSTLLSHSFSKRAISALTQATSSLSCRSKRQISIASSICFPRRSLHTKPMVEFARIWWQISRALTAVRPLGVGHASGSFVRIPSK